MKIIAILAALTMISTCVNQTPIPSRQEGVEIGNPAAPSRIDLFLDPHCPMSAAFFSILTSILDANVKGKKLRDSISINLSIFPLPYHHNSFFAATALNFFRTKHVKHFTDFLQIQFDSIDKYTVDAKTLNELQVQQLILQDAKKAFGSDDSSDVSEIFSDASYNNNARITFKYGAFKGVTSTPSLFINHVLVTGLTADKNALLALLSNFVTGSEYEL